MATLDPVAVTAAMIGAPIGCDTEEARREEMIGVFNGLRCLCVHLVARGICTPAELATLFSNQARTAAPFSSHRALPAHLLSDEMLQLSGAEGRILS